MCGQLVHLFITGEGPQEGRHNVKRQREDYGRVLFRRYGVQSLQVAQLKKQNDNAKYLQTLLQLSLFLPAILCNRN